VGEGDGEAVGDAVGVLVVAGPVEGTGVVVVAVRSGRCSGGSYGPLSTADNAATTTTATSKHAGASTSTRGTRTNGRTQPSKTYHNNAANTTTTATDTHHGNPRINRPLSSYTLPLSYPPARSVRSDSEASGPGPIPHLSHHSEALRRAPGTYWTAAMQDPACRFPRTRLSGRLGE
jgi:hypothetical protein